MMLKQVRKFNFEDEDYEVEKAPKRCNYRKIKLNIKQEMIKRHFEEGESISDLSKLFHLSYSTIAHILKTYKEKKVVFESKSSKLLREIEESLKVQHQQNAQKQPQVIQKKDGAIDEAQYYPFAAYWTYYYV